MPLYRNRLILLLFICSLCGHSAAETAVAAGASDGDRIVTLLFTNDVESAYDPIPAFWLDDISMIGGIAEITTLIESIRATEPNVFLFDSGDIFTGALAKLTEGKLAFELMITMGYDAMAIGNHEFEYGVEIFEWEKNRATAFASASSASWDRTPRRPSSHPTSRHST
jgi:2',3'-cyclic-nucleotide 2'-phosphodiesterase (5'-nucleotidase family)